MQDKEIIALYWARDQRAIPETSRRYGSYCAAIARNILASCEDAEECVNDTWLGAWNAMPPHRPSVLSTFLGRLTRNLAINRWRFLNTEKRGGGETALVLEELTDCVSDSDDVEGAIEQRELVSAINDFLRKLPEQKRNIFLCRYWYSESVVDISARFGMKENAVSKTLGRTRTALRRYLTERGFEL